jgi:hypothetical protein
MRNESETRTFPGLYLLLLFRRETFPFLRLDYCSFHERFYCEKLSGKLIYLQAQMFLSLWWENALESLTLGN